MLKYLITIVFLYFSFFGYAQDTLPNISVKILGGQIVISWINNLKKPIANINIQRSFDSLKNYTTIGTILNPQNFQNGYADATPPYLKMYYRVFVAFQGGSYFFSEIKRPVKLKFTNDTLNNNFTDTIITKKGSGFPSQNVFTGKDNNVIIFLPDAEIKKYTIKFYEENGNLIFNINKITETYLIIERVNFKHIGWYFFELFENGELVEKNKFQIVKEGKY